MAYLTVMTEAKNKHVTAGRLIDNHFKRIWENLVDNNIRSRILFSFLSLSENIKIKNRENYNFQ
jgi:hypothetical protein